MSMNACLHIGPRSGEWCKELFPRRSPGELRLAGKSFIRHAVDFLSQLDIGEIFMLDCLFRGSPPHTLGEGEYWSLHLNFLTGDPAATPAELPDRHPEIPRDELLVFWGTALPDVEKPADLLRDLQPVDAADAELPDGVYLLRGGKLYRCAVPLLRIDSLQSYFDLNFRLLEKPGPYILPGYNSEPGLHLGQNITIMPGGEIRQPVLVQDNCLLGLGVHLLEDTIVGNEVLIDDHTRVRRSVILDHTYIGRNMYLENKIVAGKRVIDVAAGSWVDLEDGALTRDSRVDRLSSYRVVEYLLTALLAIIDLPGYLIFRPFKRWLNRKPFFQFMFRAYPKYWRVLEGRARLVRCHANDPDYVFRFADFYPLYKGEEVREVADDYFFTHRSLKKMVNVVLLSRWKYLFPRGGTEE